MKIFYVNTIYWAGYSIAPIGIFINKGLKRDRGLLNHESIHWRQQWEMWLIPFYLWYGLEALLKWSYVKISFEREANDWEHNLDYLSMRKPFSWFKYIKSNKSYT